MSVPQFSIVHYEITFFSLQIIEFIITIHYQLPGQCSAHRLIHGPIDVYRFNNESNKCKFSRKVLSTSTQFPQLVFLQNITIITSRKTCHAVTTGQGTSTWLLFRETNGLKVFSETFRKGVIFGMFSKIPKIPKNTPFRKIPVLQ